MTFARRSQLMALLIAIGFEVGAGGAGDHPWLAAYIQGGLQQHSITLFPVTGPKAIVRLPEIAGGSVVAAFGTDGKAVYVQNTEGVFKIEFNPLRQTIVPGTQGLGSIWSFTVVNGAGRILVSGIAAGQCGTFEVDLGTGKLRAVLTGSYPKCGGGGGVVSPDGKRAVKQVPGGLLVTDLGGGISRMISGVEVKEKSDDVAAWLHRLAWSPDGHRISAVGDDGRIALIDGNTMMRTRYLGHSPGRAPISWSPDSKYLLVEKSGMRCALTLYFTSLEYIDVETGRRTGITSSGCEVGSGWLGWLDPSVAQ